MSDFNVYGKLLMQPRIWAYATLYLSINLLRVSMQGAVG